MMMGAYKLIDDSVSMQNIILKMGVVLMSQKSANIVEIGNFLLNSGCDDLADAGFWLYDYSTLDIYFSPKLKEALGSDTISTYADLARFVAHFYFSICHKITIKTKIFESSYKYVY